MLDENPAATLETVLGRLNDALERGDAEAAAALFQADSYWRDLVAFTWNIKTMEGPDQIRAMLESQLAEGRSRAASASIPPKRRRASGTSPRAGSSSRPRPAAATASSA